MKQPRSDDNNDTLPPLGPVGWRNGRYFHWSKRVVIGLAALTLLFGGGAMGAKVAVDIMQVQAVGELKQIVVGARAAAEKEHTGLTRVIGEMVRQQRIANFIMSRGCKDCPRLREPIEMREELESAELKESLSTAPQRKPYLYERREQERR